MRLVSDRQRRARIGVRHALAEPVGDTLAAARAVVCFHATEPASIYLSAQARTGATREEVASALYDDRSVVRQLAMRRTVFAFPRELVPAVLGSAAPRVASMLHRRLVKEIEAGGLAKSGERWLARLRADILTLCDDEPRTTAELRALLPGLDRRIDISPGKSYGGSFPIAPRVLSWLAADGALMRGANATGWRTSRPRWTLTPQWLGEEVQPTTQRDGYAALVGAWLDRFGPGTEDDLVWWLGATKAAVRTALADVDAEQVRLDDGTAGYVLPGDEDADEPGRWAALLPALDPTMMGWKSRGFLLGPHGAHLFDSNGNAGQTVVVGGRAVGGWGQREDGSVAVVLLEELTPADRRLVDEAGERLTAWFDGEVLSSLYQGPAVRRFLADLR